MKKSINAILIIIMLLFVFFSFSNNNSVISNRRQISKSDEKKIIHTAVSYFKKKYPEFQAETKHTYVAKNIKNNKWFVYLFDKRDKGLGYKVYYDNGNITDNYNHDFFQKRLELINYMNQLMPENKQYNEYVYFNHYDGRVSYVVVSNQINIMKQLENDYLILRKANEILIKLNKPLNRNWVHYFEAKETDINAYIKKNILNYERVKKRLDRSSFATINLEKGTGLKCIADYKIENWQNNDNERMEFLKSFDNYKTYLKNRLLRNKLIKEKNIVLLETLLTKKDREEISKKGKDAIMKLKKGERYSIFFKNKGENHGYSDIRFRPDGKEFACVSGYSKKINIYDSKTGKMKLEIKGARKGIIGKMDRIYAISYSPDGKYLAAGNFNNTIDIWESHTGNRVKKLRGHRSKVLVIAFSPDSKHLISAAEDTKVIIWNIQSGRSIKTMTHNQQYTMCFSPKGEYFVCGNQVFDVNTWKLLRTLNNIQGIRAFSNDGKYVAAFGIQEKEIGLWNFETEELIKKLKGHTRGLTELCFSPNGKYLASSSRDETIKIWDLESGEIVTSLEQFGSSIALSLDYSPDGTKLAVSWANLIACYSIE
ncbi:MAG: WD40 repeat domain-containing protein [Pseudomonadota bacterium]